MEKQFYSDIVDITNEYCKKKNIKTNLIQICPYILKNVYKDCHTDFSYLIQRRLPNGVSSSKAAGLFHWRLSRSKFIQYTNEYICIQKSEIRDIAYNVSLLYALKTILKVKNLQILINKYHNEFRELKYILEQRHSTQEMIGLIFSFIVKSEGFLTIDNNIQIESVLN
jgi:hypothetical protein